MELPATVKLDYPVEHGGVRYAELTITRRPTVEDAVAAAAESGSALATLQEPRVLARLAAVPYAVIEKLDYTADYPRVQAVLAGFRTAPRSTPASGGAASSSPPASPISPSAS